MDKFGRRAMGMLAAATSAILLPQQFDNQKRTLPLPFHKLPSECWVSDQQRKSMKDIHTNCYVWGEGYQVDASQEFSNYTPKKIRAFEG